ncbi:MAG: DUF4837 family protein [Candidatus Eisenbacteria bacterium]|nr:DUF4837 family protein [Candidatus Eisenbacteria bacterium]
MKRLFAAPSLLLAALLLMPCGCAQKKLPALGPSNLLTVVTNLGVGDESIDYIKAAFAKPVKSVEKESRYSFEVHGPAELTRQRDSRNLVLVADLTKEDAVSRKAREVLGSRRTEQALQRAGWTVLPNVEALGQTMVVVAGGDRSSIERLLAAEAEKLYARADSMVTERAVDIVYMRGEEPAMARYLESRYGWSVRIPRGFRTVEDRKNGVVKLVSADSQEPARLFLAYWTPSRTAAIDPEYCLRLRSRLAWLYYDEDRIDPGSATISETTFQGRKAVRIDGIWQNEKHLIGGPFFTLCFIAEGRLYLLDGAVFAPGMEKSPWLRQLEAVMLTFRAGRKPARADYGFRASRLLC